MRSIKFLFILALYFFTLKAYCIKAKKVNLTKENHPISLKSQVYHHSYPSSMSYFVEAYLLENGNLMLAFNVEKKNFWILVTNSIGEVIYDEYVDVTSNTSIYIPIIGLETEYSIILSDGTTKLKGVFDIED